MEIRGVLVLIIHITMGACISQRVTATTDYFLPVIRGLPSGHLPDRYLTHSHLLGMGHSRYPPKGTASG